ncbi:N-acetylmuramoyl-L-alanine amidase [Rummeliibacillus stabekisii]|uniref:N-acetylmuramoyl-L-alanine amidase n=1 Tax=Rummeliibacillus stabekisii TaxID=241244 RepID=UPI00203AF2CE|nr:N-acetylmuramoyl-L-alanine amidase [Rummeliibacillus stabekisii]MCM3316195.1 N-acetylmuramoyl-L-alanine amidase [Rummeliibacillus stabekisii]
MVKQFVISSGHGDKVAGAIGILNEHEEAKKVVNRVYDILTKGYNGVGFKYHETTATTQNQNLSNIVSFHNRKTRDLDVSIHFNSATPTATGTECLYYDALTLSTKMSAAMASALGIVDRGAKKRKELYFLRNTNKPAILLEVCFVTSEKDAAAYRNNFEDLCQAIAKAIAEHLGYAKNQVEGVSNPKDSIYYNKKFDRLVLLTDAGVYADVEFEKEINRYKKDTKIDIEAIVYTKNGTPRFLVKEKDKCAFITANREYVKAYSVDK